mmetsp:Transcript_15940/g.24827  ORF Transcript_15940/g.24827 Transcript_15940/m.24827 type:complete len:252 (+) Transcript_15940:357-1112(+)
MNAKKGDPKNLDPNYLTQTQSPLSPWHHALHTFDEHFRSDPAEKTPIFHVDIHGKMDRKDNLDLDIGMGPMENCWALKGDAEGQAEVEALKEHLASGMREAFRGALKGKQFQVHGKQMQMTVEEDPYLNAYWGGSTFETISHQSVNLRIPAIQLELPLTMRKELVRNEELFRRFGEAILQSYKYMICTFKTQDNRKKVCGCAASPHQEKVTEAKKEIIRTSGAPASKTTDETEHMLRELMHLERTIMEKQI